MRFCTTTLGCKVNQYDTQTIESILGERGHEFVTPGEGCDVCIINTCAVTAESVRKWRQAIRRMKKLEPNALIAVCGCFSQLEPDAIKKLDADLIGGATDREEFALEIERVTRERATREHGDSVPVSLPVVYVTTASQSEEHCVSSASRSAGRSTRLASSWPETPHSLSRSRAHASAQRTRALLKIQDGCDNFCAYCVIPYARGPSRSMPQERIAEHAKQLEEQGYKEIVITGIEISAYGRDFKQDFSETQKNHKTVIAVSEPQSHEERIINGIAGRARNDENNYTSPDPYSLITIPLLTALQTIQAAAPSARLRLGSLDPAMITTGFCQKLSEIPNICNHFQLSLQSGCDETLRRMGRKYDINQALQAITALRDNFSDCAITADLITGFPGETDAEFEQTLKHIKKADFADMHIFPFSPRPGTAAADMPGQIEKSIRRKRAQAATEEATQMANKFKHAQIGKTVEVLFEQEKNGYSIGHSKNYLKIAVKNRAKRNSLHNVRLSNIKKDLMMGEIV